ncbi:hypothetical protein M3_0184 [Lysinibacillus phage vB_LfM_LysYB1]|nr:hypothetical protein M3_0184 [Lysinibacillus phage vB_LfM_LysYB1]WAB25304.1 hypothetical protein M5_0126 [Lysinibacillus phage vB_LfM_LysYB2]
MRAKLAVMFAVVMTMFSMVTGIKFGKDDDENDETSN